MAVRESELAMAIRHVRQGERHVSRQREIIAEIRRRRQPTELAESLLISFEETLRAHKDHFDRIV